MVPACSRPNSRGSAAGHKRLSIMAESQPPVSVVSPLRGAGSGPPEPPGSLSHLVARSASRPEARRPPGNQTRACWQVPGGVCDPIPGLCVEAGRCRTSDHVRPSGCVQPGPGVADNRQARSRCAQAFCYENIRRARVCRVDGTVAPVAPEAVPASGTSDQAAAPSPRPVSAAEGGRGAMISELRELPQLRMRVGSESDAVALRPGLESEADPALNSFVTGVQVLSGHAPKSRRRFGPAHGMARPRQNCICPRFLNPRSKSRNTFSALHGSRCSVHAPKAHPVHPNRGNASREPRPRTTCGPSKGRNRRTPIARAGRAPSEFRPCRADCMAESGRPGRCAALVNSHPHGALERRAGGAAIHPTARQSG